ncbi:MAG: hypothetical protein GW906_12035 [Epsilonproteobacteria bacterium]|nr:hypothetical protein [Campylobacterota bacterium]PIP10967.1 MAG: hypothetical protein COX50_03090 [Sulfurimonas sp. CG23_combo_of_CG06-09_8_20_14_all_36_33]PIS25517.1 MAG: hypothetical protein COT46_05735 [Sulfurimonas sp. CG08_land_8_20_14_0_20_36_33]PIU34628.1 MAG: hypothetical protein COT05_06795 [Sulfurimonas sp. CG07_land_8_20_14_0_80_36_56]PIV05094.1 MAG: hypothetical protein COS56_02775 [Sulfurimonas sp. CG03_land_8_20_14_0_80_36_25]PIV33923.1 MAG: hypothetical protein COS32_12005 [S
MKKFNTIITVLLTLSSLLQADAYLLIMSKDDNLCQNINSMFNKDLFDYKELRLEEHKEFNAVVWDKEFEFYGIDGTSMDMCNAKREQECKSGIFDINNDGKDELVTHFKASWNGTPFRMTMRFVARDANNSLRFQYGKGISVGFKGSSSHKYKELPVQKIHNDGFKQYILSGEHVLLYPFKIAYTFYIATFFNTHGRDNWDGLGYRSQDLNDNNMVSISKYDANNEQHDICYMIRVFTSPIFQKTTKKDN